MLPEVPPEIKGEIVIQPFGNINPWAPVGYIQNIVNKCIEITGKKIFVVGNMNTPQNLQNVNYSLLKNDAPFLLSCINNAGLLLSAQSCGPVIAAAYNVPAIVWSDPTKNWHINFNSWIHYSINYDELSPVIEDSFEGLKWFLGSLKYSA